MNIGQTQAMTGRVLWLSSGNPTSQASSLHGGLAGYLWFVCVLVMIAARGDYCSQITRSRNKAKVPLRFKLKHYNMVFQGKCFWRLAVCCGGGCKERLHETNPATNKNVHHMLTRSNHKTQNACFFPQQLTYICFYIYTRYTPHGSSPPPLCTSPLPFPPPGGKTSPAAADSAAPPAWTHHACAGRASAPGDGAAPAPGRGSPAGRSAPSAPLGAEARNRAVSPPTTKKPKKPKLGDTVGYSLKSSFYQSCLIFFNKSVLFKWLMIVRILPRAKCTMISSSYSFFVFFFFL